MKVIAHYFPQLHAIPENDRWWGQGFTDWVNVKRSHAQFPGHRQPRVPQGGDYYDQGTVEVVRRQAEQARAFGVDCFAHYHYWFDGTHLLQKPTDILLENKDIDIGFCLIWANETWSRRWDGQDHHILIAQRHPPTVESWARHFDVLIKYWLDERALRIDDKPVFMVYRATKIEEIGGMFDYFQTRATREYGLSGLHFVNVVQSTYPPADYLRHFDASMLFQPFAATTSGNFHPKHVNREWWLPTVHRAAGVLPRKLREESRLRLGRPRLFDYDAIWEEIIAAKHPGPSPVYEGAYVDWDNTPRYRNRATLYAGASPDKFGRYMRRLLDKVGARPENEQLIFINAWNEWAESAYLEPDEEYGLAYLEALSAARAAHQKRALDAPWPRPSGRPRPGEG